MKKKLFNFLNYLKNRSFFYLDWLKIITITIPFFILFRIKVFVEMLGNYFVFVIFFFYM